MHIVKASHIIKTSCYTHTFTTSSTQNIISPEQYLAISIIKSHHYAMSLIMKCNIINSCMWYQNFTDDSITVISKGPHQQDQFPLGTKALHNFALNPHYGIDAFTGRLSYHLHQTEVLTTTPDLSLTLYHEYMMCNNI